MMYIERLSVNFQKQPLGGCSGKKVFLKSRQSLEKYLRKSSLSSKVAGQKAAPLIKMNSFTGHFYWFCLVFKFHRQVAISNLSTVFFWERFDCWLLLPMCQRLNYEILIARDYVRHNVVMYVIIINVILTSLSICTSLLLTKY